MTQSLLGRAPPLSRAQSKGKAMKSHQGVIGEASPRFVWIYEGFPLFSIPTFGRKEKGGGVKRAALANVPSFRFWGVHEYHQRQNVCNTKQILRGINFVKITQNSFSALIQNLATLVWFCAISTPQRIPVKITKKGRRIHL